MAKSFSLKEEGIVESSLNQDTISLTVEIVVRKFQNGEIIVPPYQREGSIWPLYKKQAFILSLCKRDYIPPLTLSEVGDDYNLVDGLQRVTTILSFFNREFPIEFRKKEVKRVYYEKIDEPNSYFLCNRDRKRLNDCALKCNIYKGLNLEEEVERFYCVQNHVPLTTEQKINFNAYRNKPNLSTYTVELGATLSKRGILENVLKLRKEISYPKTRYNLIIGTILLAFLNKKKCTSFASFSEIHINALAGKEGLERVQEKFGKKGEVLLKRFEELAKRLEEQGKKITSKQTFINIFSSWVIDGGELEKVLDKFKTYRDYLEEEDKINEKIEELLSIKTLKALANWKRKEKGERGKIFIDFLENIGMANIKAVMLVPTLERAIEYLETGDLNK